MVDATSIMGIPCQNPAAEMFSQEPFPNGDEAFGLSWGIDLARNSSSTTGTGTLTLGSGVAGLLSFASANIPAGVVYYGIADAATSAVVEVGTGTYDPVAGTLTRDNVEWSVNSNAHVNLAGPTQVSTPFQRLRRACSTNGISAIDTFTGSIALYGRQWEKLHTATQDSGGFYYGLWSAPPSGGLSLIGQVSVASNVPTMRINFRIMQGFSPDPNFPGILTQNPVEIGSGQLTTHHDCSATNWIEESTTFIGWPIIAENPRGVCSAVWVEAYAQGKHSDGSPVAGVLVRGSPDPLGTGSTPEENGATMNGGVSRLIVQRFGGAQSRNQ
jgi:hypothetical protein